jgi:hypothetical protein
VLEDELWAKVRDCFATDDGSLPGIEIDCLSSAEVSAVYLNLRGRSHLYNEAAEFWSEVEHASLPIDSVPDAAALVVRYQAAPFHICIDGLVAGGHALPTLGLFIFQDMIAIDYRMGPCWGPGEVKGLFLLLRELCKLAPSAVVKPATGEGPPDPDRFAQAWADFREEHS